MSKLLERNCYNCVHKSVCSFRHDVDKVIRNHLDWINPDMPYPADWQRLLETLAKACLRYEFTEES